MSRSRLFISAWMQKRSATTGLTVEAYLKHQLSVGVLSLPVEGACQAWREQARGKQDSCNNSAASLKSELVLPPVGFSQVTRSGTLSSGHCNRQTKFFPVPSGSVHTPPAPTPRALQKPRSVGRRRTTSAKKRGRASELVLSLCQCAISRCKTLER